MNRHATCAHRVHGGRDCNTSQHRCHATRCSNNTLVYIITRHSQIMMHHSAWRARSKNARALQPSQPPQPSQPSAAAAASMHQPAPTRPAQSTQTAAATPLPLAPPPQLHHSVRSPPLRGHSGSSMCGSTRATRSCVLAHKTPTTAYTRAPAVPAMTLLQRCWSIANSVLIGRA